MGWIKDLYRESKIFLLRLVEGWEMYLSMLIVLSALTLICLMWVSHEWLEEKWSTRNLVVSRVGRVIPLYESGIGIFQSFRCRRWNIIWRVLDREILKPCRDNHSLIKEMVSWRRLLPLSWLLDWKWILRSSANRMVLRGEDIMEVILLMARMNKVPLKGEPCGIPFFWGEVLDICPPAQTWNT